MFNTCVKNWEIINRIDWDKYNKLQNNFFFDNKKILHISYYQNFHLHLSNYLTNTKFRILQDQINDQRKTNHIFDLLTHHIYIPYLRIYVYHTCLKTHNYMCLALQTFEKMWRHVKKINIIFPLASNENERVSKMSN